MAPQDSFIDEDEDTCPLCVEEFDLSDKNFKPCPCGYQVCQFCFNNIRTNMNGLCPACRRPYDDKTIEWKVVTQEEMKQFQANIQKKAKKNQEQRQREAQKREVESLNRKHLAGLRVVQKNLVYVVGLSPGIPEQEILQTLRGDKYFGQYGKIVKIVVSNKKQGDAGPNGQSLGVYVTFARKEDAARCIAAVNGSQNGDRVLRAQLGTTKYCSAYLRNETCTNKSCMFLHEPGDNDDSYSRQDLSSINSVSTQRPIPATASGLASSSRQIVAQAPIQQVQPVAAATQPMTREASKDGSDSGDGSALPSTASWAHRNVQSRSRRGSHATSGAASSPAISQAMPVTAEAVEEPQETPREQNLEPEPEPVTQTEATTVTSHIERDPLLLELLRTIHKLQNISRPAQTSNSDALSFPPLFDEYGGEKRRAMREQTDDERLPLDQDSQADRQSVTEQVEEEAPESGSLQLGGEPEDRDIGREGNLPSNFQRRPSTQRPIQRSSNGGLFGPSLSQNFTQNLGSLSSINGRALTPQQQAQLLLLKSGHGQSGFMDQYPPGIGNQLGQGSALFQQQGHNRQSSRYSFANDGSSSSSSVKPSANPKLMAQQSSMMPTSSLGQQGNQFYGTSMQGPPPGLKSTGTPPIGMFGSGHGFGGSMGAGSAFGGMPKDNSGDMLREMLRGRGSAGSQSHDTGKREYMFPSFLQQYPSASSTPAPASGLLASLYGPQTGAFHDFGPKQKKKGKKHRHANTSSSGGGGLVDLADPSILQARMQHQQQSNAGVGQGLFGGQAQDDLGLPSLDEATESVDALVADSSTDDYGAQSLDGFEQISRASTPSVPPGFLPHAQPPFAPREGIIAKPPSLIPTSAPFTPSRSSSFIPRVATPLAHVSIPPIPAQDAPAPASSTTQAMQDLKTLATSTGLSKTIASQSSSALQPEDFPALDTAKGKGVHTSVSSKSTTARAVALPLPSKKSNVPTTPAQSVPALSKTTERRASAGLNISVPAKANARTTSPETPAKVVPASAAFPPLPSTSAATQSPITRNVPKTLRLTSTPKTEVPTTGSATPTSVTSMFPPTSFPSRQPSLASITKLERPSTPTSEIVSDNASITSASMSRANSPPPSKVGSAPVRHTTKSMQRKQRREVQKEKERTELEIVAAKTEPEVEVAPIMGRKKKQKKERNVHSAAGGSTPTASRPASPGLTDTISEEQGPKGNHPLTTHTAVREPSMDHEPLKSSRGQDKGKGKFRAQRPATPEPTTPTPEVEDEATDKPIPTPSSVFHDLLSSGIISDVNNLYLLKNPTASQRHQEIPADIQSVNQKLTITPEDRATLLAGLPVHKIADGPNRIMLTPNGDCVRNLTPDEEERYLELQSRIQDESGPTAFVSTKHHANNGFTLVSSRAVPNGPPSFFPMFNGTSNMDPVSKIQRDEALSYINQYVLPSLSSNSQVEKALNANALDTDMLRSVDASAWATWGTDPAISLPDNKEGGYSSINREGIIATGLESMTAHFAIGGDINRGQPLGNVSLLSLSEAEGAMQIARKETEGLEKRLNALIKKNRRLLLGSGH